ncbi:MAG: NUDIX domain-containing protein [Candidatus Daviesbacteria bacterium]|nr:NUDIX domain-containing protein [Candidatus Daviesbacteria bacterium]
MDSNESGKEVVDIVDKNGKVIGQATRSEVYKKGLLHPAVNIVVVNQKGQIFIQQRSSKKILPLYWDISASEHVKSGEDYKSAAIRGLKEELSIIAPVKLLREKHIQRNEYIKEQTCSIEYELVELYGVVYGGKIVIDKDEIAEGKFISFEKLCELIKNNQIKFSPWGA